MAWAAVGKNGVPMWLAYHRRDAEGAVVGMAEVVPLYRSPTLTDEELKAIRRAAAVAREMHDTRLEAALGNLLERLG
jgi:hypothetical protein